jgi:hypothetical protein
LKLLDKNTWNTFPGLEYSYDNIGVMNETEYSINRQTENRTVYIVFIYMWKLSYRRLSDGPQGDICMQARGDYLDQVHSGQMVLKTVRREAELHSNGQSNSRGTSGLSPLRSDLMRPGREAGLEEWWPKDTQTKLNLKGNYQARFPPGQMVLMVVRQGG